MHDRTIVIIAGSHSRPITWIKIFVPICSLKYSCSFECILVQNYLVNFSSRCIFSGDLHVPFTVFLDPIVDSSSMVLKCYERFGVREIMVLIGFSKLFYIVSINYPVPPNLRLCRSLYIRSSALRIPQLLVRPKFFGLMHFQLLFALRECNERFVRW